MYEDDTIKIIHPGTWIVAKKSHIEIQLINTDFQTWLLIGWQQAARQSEAMFENPS